MDDFASLNLDRLSKRELKTPEQIQKHSLDAYLESRATERALHLLSVGDDVQRLSVVKSLPSLLQEDSTGCLQRVVPRMHQTLPHGSTEYNIAACSTVQMIAKQKLVSTDNFTKSFLQNIINAIESKDTVAADSWLETLIEVIEVLPASVLQSDVLPLAVNKAHISKPIPARVSSCKILGAIASQFTAAQAKKDLLPIVISLCQDVTGDVRASMCSELPKIAAVIGVETGKLLLNSIVDLANDEEDIVRGSVIEAIANMIVSFQPDILKSTIIPLAKKLFFKSIQDEDQVLPVVALVYGKYCFDLKASLNTQDKNWFVSRYIQMSRITGFKRKPDCYRTDSSDAEEENQRLASVRELCAYNFPAMVLFCTDLKSELIDAMYSVFQNLAGDSYFLVRRRIAFCFHEVMKAMPKWCNTLKGEFVKLLRDINEKVLCGIVGNIKTILMLFSENGNIGVDKTEASKEIGQALLTCEATLSDSLTWRLHEEFLKQLQIVPKCFPADFVYNNIVPLLLTRCNTVKPLPCRIAAIKTLLVVITDPSQEKHKLRMKNKILELCNSANFYSRMLFVTAMGFLICTSPQDVKEMFFLNIIAMTEDKVPNIRLAVCKILPDLKTIASDPYDRKLIAAIESSIRKLAEEKDRDVLKQIQIMTKKMDDVDTRRGGGYRVVVDTDDLNTKFAPVPLVDTAPKPFGLGPKGRPYGMERGSTVGPPLIGKDTPSVYSTRSAATVRSPAAVGKSEQTSPRPRYGTRRKFSVTLDKDDFIVDAGIPLNSATAENKSPSHNLLPLGSGSTRSSVSSSKRNGSFARPLTPTTQNQLNNHDDNNNNNNNENDKHGRSLIFRCENKSTVLKTNNNNNNNNRKINEKPSNLPILSLKLISDDVIKTKISSSVVADIRTVEITNDYHERPVRLSDLKKFSNKRYSIDSYNERSSANDLASITDFKKSINKRHSLDVSAIANNAVAKSDKTYKTTDFNKRYSFCSDYKKDMPKQLCVSNNNTDTSTTTTTTNNNNNSINNKSVLSPKPACSDATNTGVISKNQQRPQSCVFKNSAEEKISNSKRSVSVENLPPKTNIRSASRLPVRSVEARSPNLQKQ